MNPLDIPVRLLISLILGAVVGLERETHSDPKGKKNSVVGLRSFSLIALLGALAGLLYTGNLPIFILLSTLFGIILSIYYVFQNRITGDIGITTELAMIFTYLIGVLVGINMFPMQLVIALLVVLVLILSRKEEIRGIIRGIEREEIHAFISYALIALVILPFLPNSPISLANVPGAHPFFRAYGIDISGVASFELINPFRLWFIVALITGIDMAGYALERIIGKRHGRLVASLVGGFISSTSTTQSLALESKQGKGVNKLVAAALFANLTSFLQIFILLAPLNGPFLVKSTLTLSAMVMSALLMGLFFFTRPEKAERQKKPESKPVNESEIFALLPALRFAVIFISIRFISRISLLVFGNTGLFITSVIASFTGIDAVLINVAELTGKSISLQTGLMTLILVNATNLLSKSFFSYLQGSRAFAIRFFLSVLAIIAASMIGLFI